MFHGTLYVQCACFRVSIQILKITFLGWGYGSAVRVLVQYEALGSQHPRKQDVMDGTCL